MKTHPEQSSTSSMEAESHPGTRVSAHGQALDEFRAAWQAKRERAERVRGLAQTLGGVRVLTVLLTMLVLLITTSIVWVTMLTESFELSQVWVPALGIAGCRAVGLLAGWVRTRLNRYADRLEAAEVRYS